MGRADRARRERPSRLSFGRRRPAGPTPSVFPSFLSRLPVGAARLALAAFGGAGIARCRGIVLVLALVAALGALGAAPAAQAQAVLWSATLTADKSGALFGCDNDSGGLGNCSSSSVLSDDEFTYAGVTYSVNAVYWDSNQDTLRLRTSASDTKSALFVLTLAVDDTALSVRSSARPVPRVSNPRISWAYDPATNWADGTTIALKLVDPAPPRVVAAEVRATDPRELLVMFLEELVTDSVPDKAAFAVKVGGSAGPAVTSVAIESTNAKFLRLGLETALDASRTPVTLDYTKPASNPLKDAAGNEVATFIGRAVTNNAPACPSGQPAGAIWTACLTVGKNSAGNAFGFTGGSPSFGGLSDKSVAGHTIDSLAYTGGFLVVSFGADPRTASDFWVLQVGDRSYRLGAKTSYNTAQHTYSWRSPGFAWADANVGDKVSVSLRRTDTTAPAVSAARVYGSSLTIEFDEALAPAASLANGAFTVRKTPSGGNTTTASLTSAPSISGSAVTLTLASAAVSTDTLTVAYTKPTTGTNDRLKDPAGNEVASFAARAVTNNTGASGPCAPAGHTGSFWTACLTVGHSTGTYGYRHNNWGEISSRTFDRREGSRSDGSVYKIERLEFTPQGLALRFFSNSGVIDPGRSVANPSDWTLHLGDEAPLALSDATRNGRTYSWSHTGFSWSAADVGSRLRASLRRTDYSGEPEVEIDDTNEAAIRQPYPGSGTNANPGYWWHHLQLDEGGTTTYKIRLRTYPGRDVTIRPSSRDGGAVTVSPASLTFTPQNWNTWQTITVSGVQDVDGLDEQVWIKHEGAAWTAEYGIGGWSIIATVRDDDEDPTILDSVVFETSHMTIPEGEWEDINIKLGFRPERSVTVSLDRITNPLNDRNEITLDRYHLEFTPSNWDRYQTVRVTSKGDADDKLDWFAIRPWWPQRHWARPKNSWVQVWVKEVTADQAAATPPAPRIAARLVGGRATLDWRWEASEYEGTITGWQLRYVEMSISEREQDWGAWTDVAGAGPDTRSHTVTGLSEEEYHVFQMRAMAGEIEGHPSALTIARVLTRVDGFTATSGDGQVALAWTVPSLTAAIAEWEVRRKAASAATWGAWTDIAGSGATTAAHTVTGLSNGTRYAFQVRAMATGGHVPLAESDVAHGWAWDGETPVPPDAPLLEAEAGDGNAALTWTAPEYGGTLTGWELRYGATGDGDPSWGTWTAIAGATATTAAHTVTGLSNGTEYAFELRALAGVTKGVTSERQVAQPAEETIADFRYFNAENLTSTTMDLVWEFFEGRAGPRILVKQRSVGDREGAWVVVATLAPGTTSYTVTGLSPETRYNFVLVHETDAQSVESGMGIWDTLAGAAPPAGVLTGLVLVETTAGTEVGRLSDGGTVAVSASGSYGVRADIAADATVGSVVFTLTGVRDVSRTENLAPYSLYGDTMDSAGNRALNGAALAAGAYTLTATAYAQRAGAGDVRGTLSVSFTVELGAPAPQRAAAPVLSGIRLVDASDQSTVATLTQDARIDLTGRASGKFGIVAEVDDPNGTIGSVVFSLSGLVSVTATENSAPYSFYGDSENDNGGREIKGAVMPATKYKVGAKAYAGRNGTGALLGARTVSFRVLRPAGLSVEDASAAEETDSTLDFAVTLDRAAAAAITVDYATSDGTATAGSDYTATSGTLTFAAGETAKTVSVPVLDDDLDEGSETLTLTLSNASGATIADATATGTITNSDPIPQAWLARFGRTVTGQVLDAVEARLSAPRAAGAQATLAGQALPSLSGGKAAQDNGAGENAAALRAWEEDRAALAAMTSWLAQTGSDGRGTAGFGTPGDDGGPGFRTRALTGRDFVLGTSFALTGGTAEGGGFASLWGRGAIAGFDGREGELTVDGEVTTGFLGADWASDPGSGSGAGRWMAGLALGHSTGSGGWRSGGACDVNCVGGIEAVLTGLYPYAGVDLTDRLSLWAAAGHGSGEVTVRPEGRAGMSADLTMSMGAAGLRSEVLRPEGGNGLALAVKGDGRFTRTSSDAVRSSAGNMEAAEADVWLLRTGLEGSRPFPLGGAGATLTPSFELGLRLDGGDAETGMGADLGGGLAFADPRHGLSFESRARALVAHEASGFREWGASLSASWDPRPGTDRGLSLSLRQSWGAAPSGGMDALLGRETLAGLAANDDGGAGRFEASSRLQGEVGYGLPAFGGGFTGMPNIGFGLSGGGARDWRLGWRLTSAVRGDPGFEVNLDATRSEPANDDGPPEHGVMLRGAIRW